MNRGVAGVLECESHIGGYVSRLTVLERYAVHHHVSDVGRLVRGLFPSPTATLMKSSCRSDIMSLVGVVRYSAPRSHI